MKLSIVMYINVDRTHWHAGLTSSPFVPTVLLSRAKFRETLDNGPLLDDKPVDRAVLGNVSLNFTPVSGINLDGLRLLRIVDGIRKRRQCLRESKNRHRNLVTNTNLDRPRQRRTYISS